MSGKARTWLLADDCWRGGGAMPLTDRGLRYGMSVFETFGVSGGRPLFATEHLALLEEGARALFGASAPDSLPSMNREDTGVLRVYITAGDGEVASPLTRGRTFALFEPAPAGDADAVATARLHAKPFAPFAPGRKTGNYWAHCEAESEARAAGYNHALLADAEGRLLSAALGNLFFVMEGELLTPPLHLAVRPGVMRDWIMRRTAAREAEVLVDDLHRASEVFLTNSRVGVLPLYFESIVPGPVARGLRAECLAGHIVP